MLKRIRQFLFANLGAKVIALLLALIVWVLVTGNEKPTSKEVRVQASLLNKLPKGLTLKEIRINPEKVVISGFRRAIAEINSISCADIDLAKIDRSTSLRVHLKPPGHGVNLPDIEEIEVKLEIEGKINR